MARRAAWALLLLPLLLARAALAAPDPAVARPRFTSGGQEMGSGTAFFVPGPGPAGAVAVTTAHSFSLRELVGATEVKFLLGATQRVVSVSSRLLAEPGRPFSAPGGQLADDFLVFALDVAPSGVRVLEPEPGDPARLEGKRVRILGTPAALPQDEDDVFGRVEEASRERIEVELDVVADLRGWGGAPVLLLPEERVIGILEAAWPEGGTLRLGVAPIGGVEAAIAKPLEGGNGQPFAAWATSERVAELAVPPVPGGAAAGDAKDAKPPPLDRSLALSARHTATPADDGPLLGRAGALSTRVQVELRYPEAGAIVEDRNGAFVSGRALAMLGEFKRFDVMLVIDTSGSTADMTGADVNGNGIVGQNGFSGMFGRADPGDSILAAEVAAARRILKGLDPRNTRVGLITFAGMPPAPPGTLVVGGRSGPPAITEQPLTTEYERVDRALTHVLQRGPEGLTHMTEGVRMGIRELKGFRGGISEPDRDSEKVILFFTDGQPTLPFDPAFEADNVRSVLRAADQAHRAGIRIHSFAIGPDALEGPVAAVELAERTGGRFTPVRNPGDLVEVIQNISIANIEKLTIRNVTTHGDATQTELNADGSFGALVPLETGRNHLEVVAVAADGTEGRAEVDVMYAPDAPEVPVPPELIAQRNRLLQQKLIDLRRGNMAAEHERVEATRKQLQLEIERERQAAQARADQQRKELQLEVEPPDGTNAP